MSFGRSIDMDFATVEMKLKALNIWNGVKKRTWQKLHNEREGIARLMRKTNILEKRLHLRGVKINEQDFEKFCQEKLAKMPPLRRAYDLFQVDEANQLEKELSFIEQNIFPTECINQETLENMTSKEPIMLPDSFVADENGMVLIGPNGTKISKKRLSLINWVSNGPTITRKVLMEVFDRNTLAFGSLTGKPSPAFTNIAKPTKSQLDPLKVADVIHFMTEYTEMTAKEVKGAITTKCADENKMYRQRQKKRMELALKIKTKKLRKF
uniref:BEN domain-containing protein n=1 Tax=Glossina austeni TaxID=7395 RepID=A0A1A9VW50_GLOAU